MFPLNAWYAVAWDHEIKRELFARTVCNQGLVVYRKQSGEVATLADACWHRKLPLSLGRLDGDTVICGYHGLEFAADGKCTKMPSQDKINPRACVRAYPTAERYRFVWVWMGDPKLADQDKIPEILGRMNQDGWTGDGETINMQADYRLVVDNLMDLTHETYVHGGTIGDDNVAEAPFKVDSDTSQVTLTRWMENTIPAPFWRAQLGKDGNVDRWQIIRFSPPSTIAIDVGVAPTGTGAPDGDRSQGVNGMVLNTVTPETDNSCHYFWAFTRNYDLDSVVRTTQLRDGVSTIFKQDIVVIEAQQKVFDRDPDAKFVNLNIDAGAVNARRLISKMVETETQAEPSP
ncbi:Rieske (2Fe-2S) protein [Candidatus Dependentiae bacterium]|nr:MAG: Rieske (2Fe-2S) protein [Candidatus Dependentiae bacterium]